VVLVVVITAFVPVVPVALFATMMTQRTRFWLKFLFSFQVFVVVIVELINQASSRRMIFHIIFKVYVAIVETKVFNHSVRHASSSVLSKVQASNDKESVRI
jgi:hypothetical protein